MRKKKLQAEYFLKKKLERKVTQMRESDREQCRKRGDEDSHYSSVTDDNESEDDEDSEHEESATFSQSAASRE